jgi:hypothetical protein
MFHNDITYAVMRERVQDLQAQARADHAADTVKRSRRYWEGRVVNALTVRRVRHRPATAR